MLYNVSTGIQRMALNVIRRHPNAWSVQFFRKVVDRTGSDSYGGMPTLGGIAVLDSQDEPSYHYEFLANGYAMRADGFMGQGMSMTEALDAPAGGDAQFSYALAVELPPPPALGEEAALPVELKTKDLVLFVLGDTPDAPRLAYEVATVQPTMEMPPYLPRYILNRCADFDLVEGDEVGDSESESPPVGTEINPVNSGFFME